MVHGIKHLGKVVVSVAKNPVDRFVSLYRFQWWARNLILDSLLLSKELPKFPDLSIDEFIRYDKLLTDHIKKEYGIEKDVNVGGQTIEFIKMFFRDPRNVLKNLSNEYLDD